MDLSSIKQKTEARENVVEAKSATPMMAQYLEVKAKHPEFLLFYRMGDFFELFFDDAVAAANALGIQLTKRGKHSGEDIPMCGVPVARADDYLQKLIRKGFRVAVAEQLEDPELAKKRGPKAVVRRDVVRLVTPGTLTEDALLVSVSNNFLAALARNGKGPPRATLLRRSTSPPASFFSATRQRPILRASFYACAPPNCSSPTTNLRTKPPRRRAKPRARRCLPFRAHISRSRGASAR